jgi:hypothetical protein
LPPPERDHLLAKVSVGVRYVDGVAATEEVAA